MIWRLNIYFSPGIAKYSSHKNFFQSVPLQVKLETEDKGRECSTEAIMVYRYFFVGSLFNLRCFIGISSHKSTAINNVHITHVFSALENLIQIKKGRPNHVKRNNPLFRQVKGYRYLKSAQKSWLYTFPQ